MNPDKLARAERRQQDAMEAGPDNMSPGTEYRIQLVVTVSVDAQSYSEAIDQAGDWAEDMREREEIDGWRFLGRNGKG